MDTAPFTDLAARADQFVDFACLTYLPNESVSRRRRAERLLQEHPGIVEVSLFAAAVAADVESVRTMLEKAPGLAAARGGPRGWDALLYLCFSRVAHSGSRPLAVAQLLLEHGADPNTHAVLCGEYRFTALTGAMGEGEAGLIFQPPHPESRALAKLLLDHGADPNDGQGLYNTHFTPSNEWLELLISYGLDASHKVNWGSSDLSTFDYLLGAAIGKGFTERVALLLEHGVSADGRDSYNGRTHHENAVLGGHAAIAQLLLRHGATMVQVELSPADQLRMACLRGDEDEIRHLVQQHPALREGAEILPAVTSHATVEAVRQLLDLGFAVDDLGKHGETALHVAANGGRLDVVRELVGRGASLVIRERMYGGTPAGWAEYCGDPRGQAVLEYLLDHTTDVFDLADFGRADRLAALLESDASLVHRRSPSGRTALHFVREGESAEAIIDLLLRHGADVNALDGEGHTPLDVLRANGFDAAAAALRRRGARSSKAD